MKGLKQAIIRERAYEDVGLAPRPIGFGSNKVGYRPRCPVQHQGRVAEFVRVATHPRVFTRPLSPQDAWRFVDRIDPVTEHRRTSMWDAGKDVPLREY